MSEGARPTIKIETKYTLEDVEAMADVVHRPENLAASISSGSFKTEGMIVIPCSVKSLSGIVYSYADNLLARAADVCLKEKRKLVLVVRETPLHRGHLEALVKGRGSRRSYPAADAGLLPQPGNDRGHCRPDHRKGI